MKEQSPDKTKQVANIIPNIVDHHRNEGQSLASSRSWLNYVISVFCVPKNLDMCNFDFFMINKNHVVSYSRVLWQILNFRSELSK